MISTPVMCSMGAGSSENIAYSEATGHNTLASMTKWETQHSRQPLQMVFLCFNVIMLMFHNYDVQLIKCILI